MTSTETTRTLVAGRLLDVNRAATTNDTVRRTVKALHGFYGVPVEELARAVGISRATMFTRLNGKTDFTIGEVAVLADLFECSLDDIQKGSLHLQAPPDNGEYRRSRRVVDRGVNEGIAHVSSGHNDAVVITFPQVTHGDAGRVRFSATGSAA